MKRTLSYIALSIFALSSVDVSAQVVNGRASNNAPAYLAGEASPLSLNLTGDLRVIENPLNLALSNNSILAAASTNATLVKSLPGTVYEISFSNNSAVMAYLKVYDDSVIPTCGSGTPVARFLVPASTTGTQTTISFPTGKSFANGIGYCLTGGILGSDTTPVTASTFYVNFTYR